MKFLIFFLLASLSFGGEFKASNFNWRYLLRFKVDYLGKQYDAYLVVPSDLFVRYTYGPTDRSAAAFKDLPELEANLGKTQEAVTFLTEKAQKWYVDILKRRWSKKKTPSGESYDFSKMENSLSGSHPVDDGRSSFVIITQRDMPLDIRAMIRVAVKSKTKEKLPYQDRLNLEASPSSTVFEETAEPLFVLKTESKMDPIFYLGSYWWGGGEAELKSWVKDPKETIDLVPLLYYLAEITQITRRSGETVEFSEWPSNQFPDALTLMNAIRDYKGTLHREGVIDFLKKNNATLGAMSKMEGISHVELVPSDLKGFSLLQNPTEIDTGIIFPGPFPREFGKRISHYKAESDSPELFKIYTDMGFTHTGRHENPDLPESFTDTWNIDRETFQKRLKATVMRRVPENGFNTLSLTYAPNAHEIIHSVLTREACVNNTNALAVSNQSPTGP